MLKDVFSGLRSIIIGLCIGEKITVLWSVFASIGLGIIAYGLSIFFCAYAQRFLVAAKELVRIMQLHHLLGLYFL